MKTALLLLLTSIVTACVPVAAIRVPASKGGDDRMLAEGRFASPSMLEECVTGSKSRSETVDVIEDYGSYVIGYAEFDDQGWAYSGEAQLRAVEARLRADLSDPQYRNWDFSVVVFVHGWHHNAHDNDCNVQEMRQMMKMSAEQFDQAKESGKLKRRRRMFGIYAGWRGESVDAALLRYSTVIDRRNAAEKVAKGSIRQLFADLQVQEELARDGSGRNADEDPVDWADRMFTTVVGHSYGGLIVYNGLSQDLINELTTACSPSVSSNPDRIRHAWPDEVILVNPAFEASRFETLNRLADRQADCRGLKPLPLVTVVTADNDHWTGSTFTAARRILTLFEPYDSSSKQTHDTEKDANIHAIGFVERYKTHRLCLEKGADGNIRTIVYPLSKIAQAPSQPVRPVWVVGAPKTIVNGHNGFLFVKTATAGYQPYLLQWLISMHIPGSAVQKAASDCFAGS